jgi:hypothetical protein
MDVGPMGFANVIREALPTLLVQLGQGRLVLRVDHVNDVAAEHDDVRHKVPQRSV